LLRASDAPALVFVALLAVCGVLVCVAFLVGRPLAASLFACMTILLWSHGDSVLSSLHHIRDTVTLPPLKTSTTDTTSFRRSSASLASSSSPPSSSFGSSGLPAPLAALCAESALARGGEIALSATQLTAHGPRLRLEPALWESLRLGQPGADTSALAFGIQARAEDLFGDAASAPALGRLARALADGGLRAKSGERRLRERLKAALAHVRQHDFAAGARLALDALKVDDRSFLAWHILAICQEKSGQFGPALMAYEAALKLAPKETDIAQDLARLAERLGETVIAEKLLVRFLADHPGHIEATNNLACAYRNQRRYGDAVDLLRALLQIETGSPVLWNTLGTVLSDQGEARQATVFFEEAIRLDPGFAKARYNRANVRQPLGDLEGALADIEAWDDALLAYRQGIAVAEARGDKQAAKEMGVFARRIEARSSQDALGLKSAD
jgi:Tfp pilus assembly protein PilF